MKYIKILIWIFIIALIYVSCERDDLCPESTQTTASLVMETFDVSLPDDSKNVFGLRIEGVDNDGNGIGVLEGYEVVTTNSIVLPLRTDQDVTVYKLHQNYTEDEDGNPNGGNEDILTITYIREDVFVSRACGYRTIFSNVQVRKDVADVDDDEWISLIQAQDDNQIVENEAEAHFILLH